MPENPIRPVFGEGSNEAGPPVSEILDDPYRTSLHICLQPHALHFGAAGCQCSLKNCGLISDPAHGVYRGSYHENALGHQDFWRGSPSPGEWVIQDGSGDELREQKFRLVWDMLENVPTVRRIISKRIGRLWTISMREKNFVLGVMIFNTKASSNVNLRG